MKSHPPPRAFALLISLVALLSIGLSARQFPDPPAIPTNEIDLSPTLGTPSWAYGINDIGTIVGTRNVFDFIWTPFRWSTTGLHDLRFGSRFCSSPFDCRALAVNNSDEVVGDWFTGGDVSSGLVWLNEEATRISLGTAYAINDATTVVGFHLAAAGQTVIYHAFRWTAAAGLEDVESLAGTTPPWYYFAPFSEARFVRDDGVMAGWRGGRAVIWQPDGVVKELGDGVVSAISDGGLAVGWSGSRSNVATVWRLDGSEIQISPAEGLAFDVSEAGYVVGTFHVPGEWHAFVWHEARGLQDLGPGMAHGIDEAGNIVGWRTTDSGSRATLWQAELRVEDLFIGLETIAGRLLAGIDDSQARKALRDISRAHGAWMDGDSKHASQRLDQALRAVVMLTRKGQLSDVRATAVLSLGHTLADRL